LVLVLFFFFFFWGGFLLFTAVFRPRTRPALPPSFPPLVFSGQPSRQFSLFLPPRASGNARVGSQPLHSDIVGTFPLSFFRRPAHPPRLHFLFFFFPTRILSTAVFPSRSKSSPVVGIYQLFRFASGSFRFLLSSFPPLWNTTSSPPSLPWHTFVVVVIEAPPSGRCCI